MCCCTLCVDLTFRMRLSSHSLSHPLYEIVNQGVNECRGNRCKTIYIHLFPTQLQSIYSCFVIRFQHCFTNLTHVFCSYNSNPLPECRIDILPLLPLYFLALSISHNHSKANGKAKWSESVGEDERQKDRRPLWVVYKFHYPFSLRISYLWIRMNDVDIIIADSSQSVSIQMRIFLQISLSLLLISESVGSIFKTVSFDIDRYLDQIICVFLGQQ